MQQPALKYITPEEYLAMEEAAEQKHEYYQGEIFDMAGASKNHDRIGVDLGTSVNIALKDAQCEVFSDDMKVWIKAKNFFTYPDLIIVCGKAEFYENRDDIILNPLVIFEILSNSTKSYDRAEKFELYRSVPTFQEYILIDQYRIHVEQMYLEARNKWVLSEYNEITDILKLAKVNVQIPLQEIYRRVEFKQSTAV
ncbi:Uma2 family endonuclease [candidate division KSB1 bacterium]|nr:Uma2 family endonuclease [candidate division KSB1 bacterium]